MLRSLDLDLVLLLVVLSLPLVLPLLIMPLQIVGALLVVLNKQVLQPSLGLYMLLLVWLALHLP